METKEWKVYWKDYCSNSFLYGSQISFDKNEVRFKNKLISPGSVIHEWYSKTNYQMMRIEPTLPIMEGGLWYQFEINIECFADSDVVLQIVFFDKNNEEVNSIIMREKKTIIKYPLRAYSYKVQLVNIGIADLCFHSMIITEIGDRCEEKNL